MKKFYGNAKKEAGVVIADFQGCCVLRDFAPGFS
jgi:hypothetical protein